MLIGLNSETVYEQLFPEEKQQTQGQEVFQCAPQELQGGLDFRRDPPHRDAEPFGDFSVGQMLDATREKYLAGACRHFVEFRPENIQNLIAEQFVEQIVLGQRLDRRLCEPHVGGRKLPAHV